MAGGELSLNAWLDALGAGDPVPGAGTAAAVTAAAAASLVAMTARLSDEWPEARGIVAQALLFRDRLVSLADADAEVYAESLAALRAEPSDRDERREFALGQTLDRAARAPLAIAEAACDVAWLAAEAARHVTPKVEADARGAASLAAAAAAAAAHLVEVNLTTTPGDERVRRSRRAADEAAAAAASVHQVA